jgi:enoyl-CoA hydratase/carnithine racemase
MVPEAIDALRILNDHPDTTFTVLTGEGRFFSAGADVRGIALPLKSPGKKLIVPQRVFLTPSKSMIR